MLRGLSPLTREADKEEAPTGRASLSKVWWCGYDISAVGRAVWPERAVQKLDTSYVHRQGGAGDVLVVGRYGEIVNGCGNIVGFKGKVLYVNGEIVGKPVGVGYFEIGAVAGGRVNELQVYFAAIAIDQISDSENIDAMQMLVGNTPRSSGQHFMLYLSSHCIRHRERAFDQLTEAAAARGRELPVAGGKCHGSVAESKVAGPRTTWHAAFEAYSSYKFGLTIENTVQDAYITEKILNAFLGGAVPVYYGTTKIFELFNKDAFVYYDPGDPDKALKRIEFLDSNPRRVRRGSGTANICSRRCAGEVFLAAGQFRGRNDQTSNSGHACCGVVL